MRFRISRTSVSSFEERDKLPPCEGAEWGEWTQVDGGWFIELETLQNLIDLFHKYGNLVIKKAFGDPGRIEIEIYDDYRE